MYTQINYLMNLAVEYIQKDDFSGAERLLTQALRLSPKNSEALRLLGVSLAFRKDLQDALSALNKSIKADPANWLAHSNRGNVLRELNEFEASLKSYEKAIALQPNYSEAYNNRGNLLQDLKRFDEAVMSYEKAIALQPNYVDAYNNLGNALKKLSLYDLALIAYERGMGCGGLNKLLLGAYINCKMQLCDWRNLEDPVNTMNNILHEVGTNKFIPFYLLPVSDDPHLIKRVTHEYMCSEYPIKADLDALSRAHKNKKIRLGYFSPDFRNHAVSFLIAGAIEAHDKNKFEIIAFSMGRSSFDDMTDRLRSSFDDFVDVSSKSDIDAAKMVRDFNIDIAIDLGGLTQDARPSIFAYRVAPIQIGYIGYLGTMAAPYFDYIIADEVIIPTELQDAYSEKIIYLPCYQVNDPKRKIADRDFTRAELGLPSSGFVYCSFNNNYKITPAILGSWATILRSVADSVIFLYAENATVRKNLLAEFATREIQHDRIIFAERLPREEYLARYRAADLFLDTSPYNAGTTASDALWAGLPVLTFTGKSFSARMGASILNAIGLPELVGKSQQEYESIAIDLGKNPNKLHEIKEKLNKNRLTTSLFNAELFTRNLEFACEHVYARYLNGLPPENINF